MPAFRDFCCTQHLSVVSNLKEHSFDKGIVCRHSTFPDPNLILNEGVILGMMMMILGMMKGLS